MDGLVEKMIDEVWNVIFVKFYGLSIKVFCCLGLVYKDDLGDLSIYDGEFYSVYKLLLDFVNYDVIESGFIFVGMVGLRVSVLYVLFFDICRVFWCLLLI